MGQDIGAGWRGFHRAGHDVGQGGCGGPQRVGGLGLDWEQGWDKLLCAEAYAAAGVQSFPQLSQAYEASIACMHVAQLLSHALFCGIKLAV